MHRPQTLALLFAATLAQASFSGQKAFEHARAVTAFGPRPSGSAALRKTQNYIITQLKSAGWQVSEDDFTARTPAGPVPMKNILAFRPGASGKAVALTGHYDTKRFPFRFAGANDGGSSTGFLLEMASALRDVPLKNAVCLVFFDGEEAIREWSPTDSLYGSRRLAARWRADHTLDTLTALINVDMIGDRDLHIVRELYSSESLIRIIFAAAAQLGLARNFDGPALAIEDDHAPFLRLGVRATDLIDFDYGPRHSWWHTADDTIDKLSPASFEAVGRVLIETLRRLEP